MVYFLSDAHLGSRAIDNPSAHQQKLIDMLNSMAKDAEAIYMLGDIFDFWCEYFWADSTKEQYRPILQTIRQLVESGIQVHFYIGNHDIWTFGWLAAQTGMTIHYGPETVEIYGRKVYLAHGDGLVAQDYLKQMPKAIRKKISQFIFLRKLFHNPMLQFFFRMLPAAWGNEFGYEWAKKSRLKEKDGTYPYKGEDREELVLYAKEQEQKGNHHDLYVFGHRHIELDLMLSRDSRLVILGDCWRMFTYVQLNENFEVIMMNYE